MIHNVGLDGRAPIFLSEWRILENLFDSIEQRQDRFYFTTKSKSPFAKSNVICWISKILTLFVHLSGVFGKFQQNFQALKKVQKKKEEKKAAEKKDETTEKKLPKPTIEAKESEAPKQKRKFIKFKFFSENFTKNIWQKKFKLQLQFFILAEPKPKSTPKTPKSASILNFAKKVTDSEGLRTQLFNDSKRAQQRQDEKKEKQRLAEEAKKKFDFQSFLVIIQKL